MSPKIPATLVAATLIQLTSGLLSQPAQAATHTYAQCDAGYPSFAAAWKQKAKKTWAQKNPPKELYMQLCQQGNINP